MAVHGVSKNLEYCRLVIEINYYNMQNVTRI